MKLLCVLAPFAAVAHYQARLGEFCGKADNGEFHNCHHGLTCQGAKCVTGVVSGHLRGNYVHDAVTAPVTAAEPQVTHVVHHVVHYVNGDAPHYSGGYSGGYHVVHHDSYAPHYTEPHYTQPHYTEPHYYSGSHHVIYHDQPQHYATHHYAPYHYASAPATYPSPAFSPVTSTAGWTSVKPEDYTSEGQPCSGITGLGAGQKPCAPWLACYKQTSSGWFFGRVYGGYYGAATTGICKPKVVHVGQMCGHGTTSKFGYINVGRCGWYAHCQPYMTPLGGQSLGQGICTQWPIERAEDFVDPFHHVSEA